MITSIVAIVAVLGGLIFFHELGHFTVARLFGMGVRTFSLGFGPKLFGFRSGNTDYKLSLIPLGGYVALAGEQGEEDEDFPDDQLFSNRPAWQRLFVVAAGPFFNFLLAFILYWFMARPWSCRWWAASCPTALLPWPDSKKTTLSPALTAIRSTHGHRWWTPSVPPKATP